MFKWLSKYFASPKALREAGIMGMNNRNFKIISKKIIKSSKKSLKAGTLNF